MIIHHVNYQTWWKIFNGSTTHYLLEFHSVKGKKTLRVSVMSSNTVNVLSFVAANFQGFCQMNIFMGSKLHGLKKNDWCYKVFKIKFAGTFFCAVLFTVKIVKISTLRKLIRLQYYIVQYLFWTTPVELQCLNKSNYVFIKVYSKYYWHHMDLPFWGEQSAIKWKPVAIGLNDIFKSLILTCYTLNLSTLYLHMICIIIYYYPILCCRSVLCLLP